MKREWIVTVLPGPGHEYSDSLSAAGIYGPYTEAEAKRLVSELNDVFTADPDPEHETASAQPIERLSVADALRRHHVEPAAGAD